MDQSDGVSEFSKYFDLICKLSDKSIDKAWKPR